MKARFFAIAALVLGLASCQQDFAPDTQPSGGEVSVQLMVSAPELIGATRAGEDGEIDGDKGMDSAFGAIDYLDGNTAGDARFDWDDVNIRYTMEVYDVDDLSKPIKDRQEQITDKYEPVQFEVRLIPDRKYKFVVFADFVDQTTGAALRHQIGETLNVITLIDEPGKELNDEVADCYFKSWEFSPENNTQNQTEATLTRPYAKVRVIATDLDELNLNVHPENVAIEYDAVIPTAFNAVTGSISGDNTTKTFSYNYIAEVRDNMANHVYNADYDAKVDPVTGRATHMTLFTDYILAKDEQSSIHFKMTVSDDIDAIKVVDFNTEIPIQRNYLTTVIGNVLTTNTQVDITINDNFDGYFTIDNFNVVYNAEQLQNALNNLVEGNNTIVFGDDIAGDLTAQQTEGKNIIVDGAGFKYDGTFLVVGNNRNEGAETLTFKNINFYSEADTIDFIQQNSSNAPGRYAHNIIVENCTFNGKANAVGMRFRQCYNITVKDCTVESGHSLAQFISCTGITIDGVNVKADRGVALGTSKDVVVKNSTFDVVKYGLRAEPTSTLTIENSNIKAAEPVIVRKLTSGSYDITIDNSSVLESGNEFQIVFTNGDDGVTYVIPAGTFVINDNNNFKVYPRDIIADLPYNGETKSFEAQNAAGLAALVNCVNNGENDFSGFTVTLSEDIDLQGVDFQPIGTADNKFNGTFDGQGKTISNLKIENDNMGAMFAYVGANTVIKNFKLENVDIKAKFAAGILSEGNDNVVVEDITVSGNVEGDSYAAGIVCFNSYNEDPAVVIKNCVNNATVSGNRAGGIAAWLTGNSVIENVVNNGNITGTYSAAGITNRIAGSIKNAKNYGTIVGNGTEASAGIAGTQTAASTYEYCYNYGNVTTTTDNANSSAAGILGQAPSESAKATINYCANYGAITAEQSYAAGIGYSLYGSIVANYCYNEGAVNGADGAGAIAPKAQYGANDTANYCLNAGTVASANGKVYQGSNKNNYCYYYNNGGLFNVADNSAADVTAALAVLNGGADAEFFTNENGVIVVK